jgi:hypothetical protein
MKAYQKFRKNFSDFLLTQDTNWWVEISTAQPRCIYYFGPFQNLKEAETAYLGYVEDLENESSQGIVVNMKRCNPNLLTVFEEEEEIK